MKKNILAFQTRSLLRNQKRSASLGYHRAQRVAVLVNADLNWKGLDDFLKVLESDHKEIHVMHFCKTEQAPTKEHLYFSPFDFSIFGKIKSEELLEFVKPDFDYLFVVAKSSSTFIDFVAMKINATTNIGFVYEEGNEIADLQVKPDHERELEDLLKYAKRLS